MIVRQVIASNSRNLLKGWEGAQVSQLRLHATMMCNLVTGMFFIPIIGKSNIMLLHGKAAGSHTWLLHATNRNGNVEK
jgi:hypothetical protein